MSVVNATAETLREELQEGIVLLQFHAQWCGPCKMLNPIVQSIAEEEQGIKVVRFDIDEDIAQAKTFGVMGVPALFLFKDGKMIDNKSGFMPREKIWDWIHISLE